MAACQASRSALATRITQSAEKNAASPSKRIPAEMSGKAAAVIRKVSLLSRDILKLDRVPAPVVKKTISNLRRLADAFGPNFEQLRATMGPVEQWRQEAIQGTAAGDLSFDELRQTQGGPSFEQLARTQQPRSSPTIDLDDTPGETGEILDEDIEDYYTRQFETGEASAMARARLKKNKTAISTSNKRPKTRRHEPARGSKSAARSHRRHQS